MPSKLLLLTLYKAKDNKYLPLQVLVQLPINNSNYNTLSNNVSFANASVVVTAGATAGVVTTTLELPPEPMLTQLVCGWLSLVLLGPMFPCRYTLPGYHVPESAGMIFKSVLDVLDGPFL